MEYDALLPELRAFYEHNAATRARIPKADWKVAERARFLALQREGKQRLLEIGAGTGHDSAFFHDEGLDVICTDLSPAMAERCRAKGLTAYVMDFLHLHARRGRRHLRPLVHLRGLARGACRVGHAPRRIRRRQSIRGEGFVQLARLHR